MNRLPVVLLLLLAPLCAPTAMGIARSAEAPYYLAVGVESNVDEACESRGPAVNGACFVLYPSEKSVALSIRDTSGRSVAVKYSFMDGDRALTSGHFCNSSGIVPVPQGAKTLVLLMGDPGKIDGNLPGCQLQRGVGGVVAAVFR